MFKDNRGEWINAKEYSHKKEISRSALYAIYRRAKKYNRNLEKFKRIDAKLHYLAVDYEAMDAKMRLEELYFKVREYFDSDLGLSRYFCIFIGIPMLTLNQYFVKFRLTLHERNLALIKAFETFLNKRQNRINDPLAKL